MKARELLLNDGLAPDVEFTEVSEDSDLRWIHYRIGHSDVYFVCNQKPREEAATAIFRCSNKIPEFWDAVDGSIRKANTFTLEDGKTSVPFKLGPNGSLFVIFRAHSKRSQNKGPNFPTWLEKQVIDGPWEVSFDLQWGGPATVTFLELTDWTQHSDKGIKYYSGPAVYNKTFNKRHRVNAMTAFESAHYNYERFRNVVTSFEDESTGVNDISKGARKHWSELMKFYGMVKDNLGVNLVTVLDTNIIKNYCVISDLIDRLYKEVANDASLMKEMSSTSSSKTMVRGNESKSRISGTVRKVVNPIIREIRMLETRQTTLSDKLFLNPMSRASLALKAREKKKDELDDFMEGFN